MWQTFNLILDYLEKSNKIIVDKKGEIVWIFADNPKLKELLTKSVPYKSPKYRKGISKLVDNYEAGQKIQKKLWPKYYVHKYGITNLWRLRLDNYWRMIYTLIGEKVRIVAVILEVLNHKDYNKRFGYK